MRSIGIRELRQEASKHLRDVERGETIEVTDRGRPVALLVPVPNAGTAERLIAEGRMTRGHGGSAFASCGLARVEVLRAVAPRGAEAVETARGIVAAPS